MKKAVRGCMVNAKIKKLCFASGIPFRTRQAAALIANKKSDETATQSCRLSDS
jgi:hypothetical protein